MPLGKDEFVLQRMLHADELRHPHLVSMRLEIEPADDVGNVARELAPLNWVTPQLMQRMLARAIELARQLRLTTRHKRNDPRLVLQRKANGVVRRRVARMKRGH